MDARKNKRKEPPSSTRKTHLLRIVQSNRQANRSRNQVPTNAADIGLDTGIGVTDHVRAGGNRRAGIRVQHAADLHSLDGQTGVLGLDGRDIETRPARVDGRAEVEFTPGGRVAAVVVGRDGALGGGPASLGIGVEGVVDGFAGADGELVAGLAVPTVHFAVGADLVPDHHEPVFGAGTRELDDVLVFTGYAALDADDVASVGGADVAGVGVA